MDSLHRRWTYICICISRKDWTYHFCTNDKTIPFFLLFLAHCWVSGLLAMVFGDPWGQTREIQRYQNKHGCQIAVQPFNGCDCAKKC